MPTKIYRIKMKDFWISVSYSPPHYPRQKTKKSKVPKNEINAFKSQQVQFQKSQKLLHFQRTDFGHFNSYSFKFNSGIRKTIVNCWRTIEFEWIAIEMSEVCAVETEHFLWF